MATICLCASLVKTSRMFYVPNKHTMHAEEVCIQKVSKIKKNILSKSTIYIAKIDRNGNYKNSHPCDNCQRIIRKYNIKKVVCFI